MIKLVKAMNHLYGICIIMVFALCSETFCMMKEVSLQHDTELITPLHLTAMRGDRVVVENLITMHSRDAVESQGGAALSDHLHEAVLNADKNAVQALVRKGTDPNEKDSLGNTSLHYAVFPNLSFGDQTLKESVMLDILMILLDASVLVNESNNEGKTALHIAAHYGYGSVVEILIRHGASVDAVTSDGKTPLHIAAHDGNDWVAYVLVSHKAQVSVKDTEQMTPLHYAIESIDLFSDGDRIPQQCSYSDFIKMLLSKGADVHAVDSKGNTSLHMAAQCTDNLELIQLLLDYGSDSAAKNAYGQSVVQVATQEGHSTLVDYFVLQEKKRVWRRK